MGLLDSLLTGSLGQTNTGANDMSPLVQIALQMLTKSGTDGGGLSSLIQQFQQAGLGQQMNSWIGTGQNLPISPEQLKQVFGQGQLGQMASSSGLQETQISGGLAELLPQLIDGLTPKGQVPTEGIDGALSELSRLMPR
jgi:uncharacterized protein YidB (DUF937 family)